MDDSISAFFQCFGNKRAVFECLGSFRRFYPLETVSLVSDAGEDFSDVAGFFKNVNFRRSDVNSMPNGRLAGLGGLAEYLSRIYAHCLSVDSRWVVLLEEDVATLRRVRSFPAFCAAGPRLNPYSDALTAFLVDRFGPQRFGYGMCGGSIFSRDAFVAAYRARPDFDFLASLDDRVAGWGDIPLTLLFQVCGFGYGVWGEVSERTHPGSPIVRDSAFDHAFKFWYGVPWDDSLIE